MNSRDFGKDPQKVALFSPIQNPLLFLTICAMSGILEDFLEKFSWKPFLLKLVLLGTFLNKFSIKMFFCQIWRILTRN
jgi:hypothetical protein